MSCHYGQSLAVADLYKSSAAQVLPAGYHMMPDGRVMKDSDHAAPTTMAATMAAPLAKSKSSLRRSSAPLTEIEQSNYDALRAKRKEDIKLTPDEVDLYEKLNNKKQGNCSVM